MRSVTISFFLLLTCTAAFSQTVYKCGNLYSQNPCANDAKKIDVKPAMGIDCSQWNNMSSENCKLEANSAEIIKKNNKKKEEDKEKERIQKEINTLPPIAEFSKENIEKKKNQCISRILANLKDPDSVMVGELKMDKIPVRTPLQIFHGSKWTAGITSLILINARNSHGGYVGAHYWACYFDVQGERVIGVKSLE